MLAMGPFGYLVDYYLGWVVFLSLVVHTWCFFRFFPRTKRPRTGLVLGNVLVLGCLLGAAALVGETYLRFVSVQTDAFGMSLPARRWFALYANLNSVGCRDAEWQRAKPEGVRRIAFVGDSFAYGWGIEKVERRFADIVGSKLPRGTAEVMNVAKPGWGTADQIEPIADMIEVYGVDEVVLCLVPNDIEKAIPVSDEFNPTKPPEPRWFNPETSCLADYLYRRIVLPRRPTVRGYHDWLAAAYADDAIWRRYQEQLGRIIDICRQRDVTLRVVILPFLATGGEHFSSTEVHAVLTEFFRANEVPSADLLPAISNRNIAELVVNNQDAHPNAAAHALFADAIFQSFYGEAGP